MNVKRTPGPVNCAAILAIQYCLITVRTVERGDYIRRHAAMKLLISSVRILDFGCLFSVIGADMDEVAEHEVAHDKLCSN